VIAHGSYADHAHLGAPLALDILTETGRYTASETDAIYRLIYHHSDKHVQTENAWEEFGKDADVLDCFLYPGAFDYYLKHKSLGVFVSYLDRARAVWREIGMPPDPRFELLEGYRSPWLVSSITVSRARAVAFSEAACDGIRSSSPPEQKCPPFLFIPNGGTATIFFDGDQWAEQASYRVLLRDLEVVLAPSDTPDAKSVAPGQVQEALDRASRHGGGVLFWPGLDGFEVLTPTDRRWSELSAVPATPFAAAL
jgi:hypothetical protein